MAAPSPPPPPRRAAALLLLSLVVLAAVAHSSSATSRSHAELHDQQTREAVGEDTLTAADERCGGSGAGVEGEYEECLMRRTLAAHTDYIYTQGGGHN